MNEPIFTGQSRESMAPLSRISESNGSVALVTAEDGYPITTLRDRVRESGTPEGRGYDERFLRFEETLHNFMSRPGDFARQYRMREALATSDMPLLFTDSAQRQLMAEYNEQAGIDWRSYADTSRFTTTLDAKKFYSLTAGDAALDRVNELGEYRERSLKETEWSYKISKYGNRWQFSFEFFLRQDVDVWQRSLRALATGAVRREARVVTSLFVDANGPHASLYNGGNNNIITGNPALSPAGFDAAWALLGSRIHPDTGEPIIIDMAILVIPPQLVETANTLFNATEWIRTWNGREIREANPYRGRVRVVVNPYIPVIANVANGASSWFLFASPNNGRPAIQVGFLAGHETPELFLKEPNQRRIGGGSNLFDGSFENDSLENKIRMFIGGGRIDSNMTMASNGTGV